jgi:hypothetical protein
VQTLAQIDVERMAPAMSVAEKVAHFVRITMLYLEDDDAVAAERFFIKVRAPACLPCASNFWPRPLRPEPGLVAGCADAIRPPPAAYLNLHVHMRSTRRSMQRSLLDAGVRAPHACRQTRS